MSKKGIFFLILLFVICSACSSDIRPVEIKDGLNILAAESFLADLVKQVSGTRVNVDTLVPSGIDPHMFEPTPRDVVKITDADLIVINGGGLEDWANQIFKNLKEDQVVIEASAGLASRQVTGKDPISHSDDRAIDPHFWLDPNLVIVYVRNIQSGLEKADPTGTEVYQQNADAYVSQLIELDTWIRGQISAIPEENRILVTNHESLGYFADQYGFTVAGTIIPGFSTGASPSAKQLADLIEHIRALNAPAIFVESGVNTRIAEQIAEETGVQIVTDLYTHTYPSDGVDGSGYVEMMKWNVNKIVQALSIQ